MKYLKKFHSLNESQREKFPTDPSRIKEILLRIFDDSSDELEDLNIIDYIEENIFIHPDGTVDFKGSIYLEQIHGRLPIKFGEVSGVFGVSENYFSTLEGFPDTVGGDFFIDNCGITSLVGGPKKVGGYYICSFNELKSLEGCPEEIGETFICSGNPLTSLKGGPKKVGRDYEVTITDITDLTGSPRYVPNDFRCTDNEILTSLKGAPEEVGGDCNLDKNPLLTSLVGSPKNVGGDYSCAGCDLKNLEGCPEQVNNFNCYANEGLTSLKGGPKRVNRHYVCSEVNIETLEHLPQYIGSTLILGSDNLYSPEGLRDVDVNEIRIWGAPMKCIFTLFDNTKQFQESLDYNYIVKRDGKWMIKYFKLLEASKELGFMMPWEDHLKPFYTFLKEED